MKLLTSPEDIRQLHRSPATAAGVTALLQRNISVMPSGGYQEKRNALQSSRFNECLRAVRSGFGTGKTEAGNGSLENCRGAAEGGTSAENSAIECSSNSRGGSDLNMASSSDILSIISSLFTVKSGKEGGASSIFSGLHEGSQGGKVRALQQTLVTWMPEWKGVLQIDGIYGPQTNKALEIFKKVHGFGVDGSSMDVKSAAALAGVSRGDVLSYVSEGGSALKLRDELLTMGGCTRSHSQGTREYTKAQQRIANIAEKSPCSIVNYQNHSMQAATAVRFIELEHEIAQRFPGRSLLITSTMDGRHQDPGHAAGLSIDFVIANRNYQPVDVSSSQSGNVEQVCRELGFATYNEYINDSRYKTGPHMHISCKDRNLSYRR
ncbi:MAG: peptidoglycan-binding protein [Candidatus Xenobiia bacterium LiM19]